jgi:steroid delta-isomerase-like uncharacterized protein
MSKLEPKAIVQRYLKEGVSGGNMAALDAYVAQQIVFTSPYTPAPIHGIEAFKQMIGMLNAAFPDLKIEEEEAIAEGDTVATRWFASGTHTGSDFAGHPASGRAFRISGISLYKVQAGKIVAGWVNDDNLGMLQQLGMLPLPAQA